jgi:hypothetical protein
VNRFLPWLQWLTGITSVAIGVDGLVVIVTAELKVESHLVPLSKGAFLVGSKVKVVIDR